METKMLNFDMEDENQKEAYLQLDRVRYYQTRFITKLVNDFFRSHNITLDTPYFDTKKLVKAYISGYVDIKPTETVSGNETINMLIANMVQQQTMLQQQMANMMVNANPGIYVGMPDNSGPVLVNTYQSPDTKSSKDINVPPHQKVPDNSIINSDNTVTSTKTREEEDISNYDDDDDFDDDLDIAGLSSGFANMSQ